MSHAAAEKEAPEKAAPKWRLLGIIQKNLTDIRLDGGTQSRADGVDAATVKRYAEEMKAGAEFDYIDLFRGHDDRIPRSGAIGYDWLAHGFHRYHAMKQNGVLAAFCRVYEGSRRDAVLFSVGCNAIHGRQRSTKDIRHAVRMLLEDPEWWHKSVNWIAQMCRVDWRTANRVKDAMIAERQLAGSEDIDLSSLQDEDDETVTARSRHGGTLTRRKGRRSAKVKPVRIETEASEIARIWSQVKRSDIKYVRQCLALDLSLTEMLGRIVEAYMAIPSIAADGTPRVKCSHIAIPEGPCSAEVPNASEEPAQAA